MLFLKRLTSIVAVRRSQVKHFFDQLYNYCQCVTLAFRVFVMYTELKKIEKVMFHLFCATLYI